MATLRPRLLATGSRICCLLGRYGSHALVALHGTTTGANGVTVRQNLTEEAFEVFGGRGRRTEQRPECDSGDARRLTILDGSTESQKLVVG